jgi:hypothetical protein
VGKVIVESTYQVGALKNKYRYEYVVDRRGNWTKQLALLNYPINTKTFSPFKVIQRVITYHGN